jgi:hypothetical protein
MCQECDRRNRFGYIVALAVCAIIILFSTAGIIYLKYNNPFLPKHMSAKAEVEYGRS